MFSTSTQENLPKDFRPIDVSQLMPGKTVLWDHHPCGPPVSLHFTLYQKPKVAIKDKILGLVSLDLEGRRGGITYSNFSGSLAINGGSAGYGITVFLKNIKEATHPAPMEGGGEILAPVVFSWKSKGHIPWDVDHYQRALQSIYDSCRDGTCLDLGKMIKVQVSCTVQGIKCDVAVEMCTVDTVFKAIPIPPISVQSSLTDLYCDPPATGFITVDAHKRLHQISENDHMACKLPLVGIWMKGICTVFHPLVWAACVRYISSTAYEQRLCLPPQPFLICLYNPLKHQPEFYDCISVLGNSWLTSGFERGVSFTTLAKVPIVDSKVTVVELTKIKEVPSGFNDAAKRIIQTKISSPHTVVLTDSEDMPQLSHHPHLPKKINICPQVPEVSLMSEDGFDVPTCNVTNLNQNHNAPVVTESHALHFNKPGEKSSCQMTFAVSSDGVSKSVSQMCGEATETNALNNNPVSSTVGECNKLRLSQEVIRLPVLESGTEESEMLTTQDLISESMQDNVHRYGPKSKEYVPNRNESLVNKYVAHIPSGGNVNTANSETLASRKHLSNTVKTDQDSNAVIREKDVRTSEPKLKNCVTKKSCLKKKISLKNPNSDEYGNSSLRDRKLIQKVHKLPTDKSYASSAKSAQNVHYGINTDVGGKRRPPKQTVTATNAELTEFNSTDENCKMLQKSVHSSSSHGTCSCVHLQERLSTLEKQVNILHSSLGNSSSVCGGMIESGKVNTVSESSVTGTALTSDHSEDSESQISMKDMLEHIKHLEELIKNLLIKQTTQSSFDKSQMPIVSPTSIPALNPVLSVSSTQTLTPQHSPQNSYFSRDHLVHRDCDLNSSVGKVSCMSDKSQVHVSRSAAVTVTNFTCSSHNTPICDGTNNNVTGPILQQCNRITTATMTSSVWPFHAKKCDSSVQTSMFVPVIEQRDCAVVYASKSYTKKKKCKKVLPSETQMKTMKTHFEKPNSEIAVAEKDLKQMKRHVEKPNNETAVPEKDMMEMKRHVEKPNSEIAVPEKGTVLPMCISNKERITEVLDNDVQFSLQDIQIPTILGTNNSPEHSIHVDMEDYPATVYGPDMEKSDDECDSSDASSSEDERKKGDANGEYKNSVPYKAFLHDFIGNADKLLQKQKMMEKNRLSLPEQQLPVQCYDGERRYSENQKDDLRNRHQNKGGEPLAETSIENIMEWKRSFFMRSRYSVPMHRGTDLSVEVDILADKYLSEEQDEHPSGIAKGACAGTWQSHKHSSDLSVYGIDSTNMSIATKKYLDRHQLTVPTNTASKQFFDDDRLDSSF